MEASPRTSILLGALAACLAAAARAGGREETKAAETADTSGAASPSAKPPVGPHRWRALEAPEPWSGTREALHVASPCVQFASSSGAKPGTPMGDVGCLYLNVYAPRFLPGAVPEGSAGLPVMLSIHGGGNSIGSTAFYDGSHLASTRQVVVVTTSYRPGPFG